MIERNDWIDGVDFAWIGLDGNKVPGLFYVPSSEVPNFVRNSYTFDSYNLLTDFIIDELNVVGNALTNKAWAKADAEKGLYVFEYNVENKTYIKIAEPDVLLSSETLGEFSELLISLKVNDFKAVKEIPLESLVD